VTVQPSAAPLMREAECSWLPIEQEHSSCGGVKPLTKEDNMLEFPLRCQLVTVTFREPWPGYLGSNPIHAKPNSFGVAEEIDFLNVKITLDDGTELAGKDCWWQVCEPDEAPPLPADSPFAGMSLWNA
jgi:hypothetical protein